MTKKIILLIQIFSLLIFLKFYLKVFGIKNFKNLIEKKKLKFHFTENINLNIKLIRFVAKHIPGLTCLIQSGALKWLMKQHLSLNLVIGISNLKSFSSHAWIELNNEIIFGALPDQQNYLPIMRIT